MHNRKKLERPPTEAEILALQKKTQTYASLVSIIFQRRKDQDLSKDTLDLVGKMLRNNPDFYSLWNFRREILLSMNPTLSECSTENKYTADNAAAIRDEEMNLSADGIRKNPKSYGAWHHRQWIIGRFDVSFDHELTLCKEFLRQDQRNFHCWNYRRFVVATGAVPDESELAYSAEKIQENFSNYSAFHHRSIYIKRTAQSVAEVLPTEFDIIENAVFTEPDDQSAWWYHQFLLTWADSDLAATDARDVAEDKANWLVDVLQEQLEKVHGLYELEENCTWVMNCLISLIDRLCSPLLAAAAAGMKLDRTALLMERKALLEKLVVVDPNHKNRYVYMLLNTSTSSSSNWYSASVAINKTNY